MSDASLANSVTGAQVPNAIVPADGIPRKVVQTNRPSRPQFAFTGRAGDYFRIWIVNLLLTLITLGLWSPWAKVRKRHYFYGHTWLDDANFEYHGNPVAILRGRLIAAAAISVYWVIGNLVPRAAPWMLGLLLCGTPWIIARSLTFNAANSSFRGIRFRFSGTARDVALAIWPLALSLVVRVTRYRLEAISAEIEAPLATVMATITQNPHATGEELGEVFGFDLAL